MIGFNHIKKLIPVCLLVFFSFCSIAQTSSNKSFTYESYAYPALPVANASSYSLQIYVGPDTQITERDFQRNKARKKLASFVGEQTYAYSKPFLLTADDNADIMVEVAFGDFAIINKELKNTKVACKRVGAKINSMKVLKENVKMCPGFYYELTYRYPYILSITKADGEVLFMKAYDKKGTTSFGYDKSGLTGYLVQQQLDSVYQNTNPAVFSKASLIDQMARAVPKINTALFFTEVTDDFKIGSGRGGKHDYTALTALRKKVIDALEGRENVSETLREAITVWEKTIEEVDLADKKARINRKVATAIYGNLALAYLYTHQFEKVEKYVKEHQRLARMAINQEIAKRANFLSSIIRDRKARYQANPDMRIDNPVPIDDVAAQLSNKKHGISFVTPLDKYDEFQQRISEREAVVLEEDTKEPKKEANTPENTLEKYRNRITHTSIQGYTLFLNDWYDSDLVNKALPVEICQLTELNDLRPYGLKLTSIPDEIGNLANLIRLDLSGNKLETIPASIGKLEKLKVLDISNNSLKSLPEAIKNLSSLRKLKLKGNSFSKEMQANILSWVPKKCKVKF